MFSCGEESLSSSSFHHTHNSAQFELFFRRGIKQESGAHAVPVIRTNLSTVHGAFRSLNLEWSIDAFRQVIAIIGPIFSPAFSSTNWHNSLPQTSMVTVAFSPQLWVCKHTHTIYHLQALLRSYSYVCYKALIHNLLKSIGAFSFILMGFASGP